jgi:hypothetical protein
MAIKGGDTDFHDAVLRGMIVDRTSLTLGPAEDHQVVLSISVINQVSCVPAKSKESRRDEKCILLEKACCQREDWFPRSQKGNPDF